MSIMQIKYVQICLFAKNNLMKKLHHFLAAFIAGLTLVMSFSAYAQGDLMVTPRRIIFEGNKQTEELTLANTGNDTARYSISFLQYRMTPDGAFDEISIPDSGQYFADEYLRFFPRSVTLAPNEAQVVRMQVRRKPDMVNAEYRSHIYFRAIPTEKPLGTELSPDSSSIGVRLIPVFGISIPTIIRVGELEAEVAIVDPSVVIKSDSLAELSLTFFRKGDKSVYGDIKVMWAPENSTEFEPVEVGIVRGLAVYTPNTHRKFRMNLLNTPEVDYRNGKLIISYKSSSDLEPEVFAEKEVLLK